MKKEDFSKLWVLKLCLKILYPKFNINTFLVFLAIKSRYYINRGFLTGNKMSDFTIKTLPKNILGSLLEDLIQNENLPVLSHKCIVISKDQFIQLTVENFFYKDNGVLWVIMKLASETKKIHKDIGHRATNSLKYNLNFVTSEIHKKLWTDTKPQIENERIVPVVGSNLVPENMAYTNEDEYLNILSTFGLDNKTNIDISFHPINCFEYSPKIAAAAEVNLVVNEYDLENDFLKEVLSNHFEIPKVICPNDIISIDLTPKILSKYNYKYLDLVESTGKIYFKCKKLQAEGGTTSKFNNIIPSFYIIKGVTQLTLGENTHAVKPKIQYFETHSLNHRHSIHLCPDGLREKFDHMQETLNLFLNGDIGNLCIKFISLKCIVHMKFR